MLKKAISATAASIVLAAFTVFPAAAAGRAAKAPWVPDIDFPAVSARSAVLMEASTGAVLYEKDPDAPLPIASTTKLMTALVVLERMRLSDTVAVPPEAVGVEGSSLYLQAGEELTVRELLYGMLLESGNDAAQALAVCCAGSVEAFADLMNEKVAALGLENTHFVNPHGLSEEGHYSSARDLAIIMRAAMEDRELVTAASTRTASFGSRRFTNHNRLLRSFEGMLAGKTGYTKLAGRTLVTCAEREGVRLICVTLDDGDDWTDHAALYNAAFAALSLRDPVPAGEAWSVPVISGDADAVPVRAASGAPVLTAVDARIDVRVTLPPFVYADVTEGDRAGELTVTVDGETAARVDLVYARTVRRETGEKRGLFARLGEIIKGAFD